MALADWSGRNRGGYLISLQRRSLRGDISGAFVSLRTITGPDAEFAAAIRRASHEGPDILLVTGPQTELPLHEAILASTGGRLVIVAVVAPTTVDALRILVGQSGLDRDAHLRRALAASFRAAVGYRSLRRIGGGRMLIQDIILGSNEVRPLLEAADFDGLASSQRQGSGGMRSVDEALARAIRRGHVSLREAAAHAVDRRHMVALVRMLARTRLSRTRRLRTGEREIHMPISLDDDRLMDRVGGCDGRRRAAGSRERRSYDASGTVASSSRKILLDNLSQLRHALRAVDADAQLRATVEPLRVPRTQRAQLVDDPPLVAAGRACPHRLLGERRPEPRGEIRRPR